VLVVAVVLGLTGACGSGDEALRATPTTAAAAPAGTEAPPATSVPPDSPRAAPRWETVSTFSGTGAFRTPELDILAEAMARVYELDDRRVVRFENFEVSTNTDLFVWLSEAVAPRTTVEAQAAPRVSIGNLKATLGDQNDEVPPDLPDDRIRSIVIWCEPVSVAYIAAPLDR
jgi:hypothetical protein